jgi:hypothetical protein
LGRSPDASRAATEGLIIERGEGVDGRRQSSDKREALRMVLRGRFGALPEAVEQRIAAADVDQLDAFLGRQPPWRAPTSCSEKADTIARLEQERTEAIRRAEQVEQENAALRALLERLRGHDSGYTNAKVKPAWSELAQQVGGERHAVHIDSPARRVLRYTSAGRGCSCRGRCEP